QDGHVEIHLLLPRTTANLAHDPITGAIANHVTVLARAYVDRLRIPLDQLGPAHFRLAVPVGVEHLRLDLELVVRGAQQPEQRRTPVDDEVGRVAVIPATQAHDEMIVDLHTCWLSTSRP